MVRPLRPGRLSRDEEARLGAAIQRGLAARRQLAHLGAGSVERAQLEREVEEGRAAAERFVTANLG